MHQKFITFIEAITHIPDYEKELCYQYFEPIVVSKNSTIEKAIRKKFLNKSQVGLKKVA